MKRSSCACLVLAALGACSTWQPPPFVPAPATPSQAAHASDNAAPQRWAGHMSLRLDAWQDEPARAESFLFDLRGTATTGVLDISTPLGTLVASVRWQPQSAIVLTREGTETFDTMDKLLKQTLGESLPVATLLHWLAGRADPSIPSGLPQDGLPTAGRFVQQGWLVNTQALPQGQLRAERPATPDQRGARLVIRLDS